MQKAANLTNLKISILLRYRYGYVETPLVSSQITYNFQISLPLFYDFSLVLVLVRNSRVLYFHGFVLHI